MADIEAGQFAIGDQVDTGQLLSLEHDHNASRSVGVEGFVLSQDGIG